MRHRAAGKIADNLWYLGREEAGVYILEGKVGSIMINGGLAHILPDVLSQMKEFAIDPAKLKKILILHSHFDHIGVIPYFKRNWPAIEVYGSEETWRILKIQKAIDIANQFSKVVADKMGLGAALAGFDYAWRDDITGQTVGEGSRIDLGGTALDILYTPGHTHCSITAYEPRLKALFPSDGGGIPYRDMSFASANTNFTQYLESLEKMKPLAVETLCADHYGYVTGEDARGFIDLTIREGRKLRAQMEGILREKGNVDEAAKAMTVYFYRECPDYFIAADILEGVFRQMMKFLEKNLQS
jgi:glyoxylase-like metal-dependent hydrolase (beta-lactamase superfamily II)